ncbi:BTB/POZ domain-containing protein 2-like [Ostrinia nubilalis]|uniref:BTB/POZ domain-containing protein 2-like n=1 Tax=Ostrinia nubilalis TaxID=29057 RepID=UPI0030822B1A
MTAFVWPSPHKDSKSRLKHLFETKVLSDCSFMVGKINAQLVLGHRVIISAASPVLEDKLKAAGTNPKVTLTDVDPEIFQLMLKDIYTDSVDVNSETAFDLATAAMAYQMPHLLNACLEYITANLTTKNVLQAYGLVLHLNDIELKKKCEELIKTKTKEVLADSSFEEACLDVVVAVFSLESLDVESELDLLNAADRYAKHITKCTNVNSETLDIQTEFKLLRADKGQPFSKLMHYEFSKESSDRGIAEFIEISKLLDPNNHYIEDGAVTFQCHIKADKPQGL